MNNNDLVAKLLETVRQPAHDGGVSYQNFVNELASLLFLKMCKRNRRGSGLPAGGRLPLG